MNEQSPTTSATEDRPIAAAYARIAQRDQGEIQRQLQAMRVRAATDGFILPPELEFSDDESSNSRMDRPGLPGLLDRIRTSPRFDRLYVEDPTRILRDDHLWSFLEELRASGIEVRYLSRCVGGAYVPDSEDAVAEEIVDRIQRIALQHEQAELRAWLNASLQSASSSAPAGESA
ncbi:MAG TPA: recombinase family protein [Longimicrobium sp.]|jgi:hypothetical protein|uniref:recombinase family protein n=1 Tax=Longimicrobium sp. TaxID=2029185 RepID=UPI002ED7C545